MGFKKDYSTLHMAVMNYKYEIYYCNTAFSLISNNDVLL